MNRILSIIIVFILCLSCCFVIFKKQIFSENENRILSVFPEITIDNIFNNNLTQEIDNYINDHFPFRDEFLKLKTKVEIFMGKTLINGVIITEEYLFLEYQQNLEIENIVDKLNKFYENNQEIEMNLLLIPSSSYINKDRLPNYLNVENEQEDIFYIKENIEFQNIDVVNNLNEFNKINDVYFKSDHHYSIYGAYAVYKSFCEYKEIEFNYDLKLSLASDNFFGTLSSKVNIFEKYTDNIYFYETSELIVKYHESVGNLYDYSYLNQKDKYSFFLGGNHSLVEINTQVQNDKSILIIKDSYANSFIPFLTDNYETIYVIDLRFYNLAASDFIKENNVSEVLFLYSSSGFNSTSGLNLIR